MERTVKPTTARTKRLLDKRAPKLVENPKQALFIRASTASQNTQSILTDLFILKKPDATKFSKKNVIHPFEDASSLEFFAEKQDASLFIIGSHSKKRPQNITFARTFDHKLLDMVEVGVSNYIGSSEFKNVDATAGVRPLLTFSGSLWEVHPRYQHFKGLMMDFFRGLPEVEKIEVEGLQYVISLSVGEQVSEQDLPSILFRVYLLKSKRVAGSKFPRIELEEMGPRMDFKLGRWKEAAEDVMKMALKKAKDTTVPKTKKNVEIDRMGDKLGRIHVGVQDLRKLQTRKLRGLKRGREEDDEKSAKVKRKKEEATAAEWVDEE